MCAIQTRKNQTAGRQRWAETGNVFPRGVNQTIPSTREKNNNHLLIPTCPSPLYLQKCSDPEGYRTIDIKSHNPKNSSEHQIYEVISAAAYIAWHEGGVWHNASVHIHQHDVWRSWRQGSTVHANQDFTIVSSSWTLCIQISSCVTSEESKCTDWAHVQCPPTPLEHTLELQFNVTTAREIIKKEFRKPQKD